MTITVERATSVALSQVKYRLCELLKEVAKTDGSYFRAFLVNQVAIPSLNKILKESDFNLRLNRNNNTKGAESFI